MRKRKKLFFYIVAITGMAILAFLYFLSYPYAFPIAEVSNSTKLAEIVYEPAEWGRNISDVYWEWSEEKYRQEGGCISPKDRFFFHTPRRNLAFYDNGQKEEDSPYCNGKLNGVYHSWYKDGAKRSELTYKNDKLDGVYENWYKNGCLNSRGFLVNGEIDGKSRAFFPNGNIEFVNTYKNGIPIGEWRKYWSNGKNRYHIIYDSGKLVKVTWWNKDGLKLAEMIYNQGNPWNGTLFLGGMLITFENGQFIKAIDIETGKLTAPKAAVSRINDCIFWNDVKLYFGGMP